MNGFDLLEDDEENVLNVDSAALSEIDLLVDEVQKTETVALASVHPHPHTDRFFTRNKDVFTFLGFCVTTIGLIWNTQHNGRQLSLSSANNRIAAERLVTMQSDRLNQILANTRDQFSRAISELELSETRYRAHALRKSQASLFQYSDGQAVTMLLEVRRDQGVNTVYFVVPRQVVLRNRMQQDGDGTVRQYTVALPYYGPMHPVDVAPFGCTSCDSVPRFDSYVEATRLADKVERELTANEAVRLGRAAFDFGEAELAYEYLRTAASAARKQDGFRLRHIKAEVGKTLAIMGREKEGLKYIEEAMLSESQQARRDQLRTNYLLHFWLAQFFATEGDESRAMSALNAMIIEIESLEFPETRVVEYVEQAYGAVLLILQSIGTYDPKIPVPNGFKIFDGQKGWIEVAPTVRGLGYGDSLPSQLQWGQEPQSVLER